MWFDVGRSMSQQRVTRHTCKAVHFCLAGILFLSLPVIVTIWFWRLFYMKQFVSNCSFRGWSQSGTFPAVGAGPPFKLHQMTVLSKGLCHESEGRLRKWNISALLSLWWRWMTKLKVRLRKKVHEIKKSSRSPSYIFIHLFLWFLVMKVATKEYTFSTQRWIKLNKQKQNWNIHCNGK